MTEGGGEDVAAGLVREIANSTQVLGLAIEEITATQRAQIEAVTVLAQRTRTTVRWALCGIVLDLILTLGGVLLFHQVDDNSDRIGRLQSSTNAGLCAQSDLFLDSYNPDGVSGKADPVAYAASFAQLEAAARAAHCDHTTRGRN